MVIDYEEIIAWRRYFHQHPECSFHEKETSKKIAQLAASFGLQVQTHVGGYGVIVTLEGKEPGKTIALRADMDALPILDQKTVSYRSTVSGTMHACGHDGHMAMLLGAAKVLSQQRNQLKGNVKFIFQPAEEVVPGGAIRMIEDGCLEGVDEIYGCHLWSGFPTGTAALRSGPVMASSDHFDLKIQGKGGHGAMPHHTVDSILVGMEAVQQFQYIVSRKISPLQPAVLTIGAFHAGDIYNVIADQVDMKGTVRTFDPSTRKSVKDFMEQTLSGICQSFGASYKLDYVFGYPPVVNDQRQTEIMRRSAASVVGDGQIIEMAPLMVGEDFGRYLEHVPGCFVFIGSGNPDLKTDFPHHHPMFDLDEEALLIGTKIWVDLILNR